MPRTSRVIASRGEFIPGAPITSVQTIGGALAQILRRGGVGVRTPRTTPVFGTRPAGLLLPSTPPAIPERTTPTISQQLTGKELASLLRRGGQPIITTGGKPPITGRTTGLLPPSTPPAIPEATISTISEPMTVKEIASLLRRGGVPVITTTTPQPETFVTQAPALQPKNPEVAPKSQNDPRAPLFTQPPTVTEVLTGAQLAEMGLPVTVAPPKTPVTPAPSEAKERPLARTVLTGGAPAVEGFPWSSQATIPSTALQSAKDPYALFFQGEPPLTSGEVADMLASISDGTVETGAYAANVPFLPQAYPYDSSFVIGSPSESQVTPPIATEPPSLPSELQDALDRQAKKRTTEQKLAKEQKWADRTQKKRRREIARERDSARKAGFATKPWADFVRKWRFDPITGENVEDPESYIYKAQGYLI